MIAAVSIVAAFVWLVVKLTGRSWDRQELRAPDEPVTPLHWRRR